MSEPKEHPKQLPVSYVMWLTIRSQFVDELAKNDPSILDRWKEFEDLKMTEMEKEELNA